MSDAQDREPIDHDTIACWRMNYGLDTRTPAEAAQWWADYGGGNAPTGCVAALGLALQELEALRKDCERSEPPALQRFTECGGMEEVEPLERLRFFCSLAMSGQDWLDVEPFFADIEAAK